MPVIIILVALILTLAFVSFQFLSRGRGNRCQWSPARDGKTGAQLSRWRCETCQVEAYSSDGRPPKECKRALKSGL